MQLFDINKVSEDLMLGVLRDVYGWAGLRNLNAQEKANFPGIDLADDGARVAIQVTATPTLDKIKSTIATFLKHNLDQRYGRLLIYVLTRKQASYSEKALDRATKGRLDFSAARDVVDFRDVCAAAANISPDRLRSALDVVRAYERGGTARGLDASDFDPPPTSFERVNLNLIGVYFPSTLFVADVRADALGQSLSSGRSQRKLVRNVLIELGKRAPSDFEVHARQLVTFHPLDDPHGPFSSLVELGTVTPLQPREYFQASDDQDRVFRSLLRLALQQKLFRHGIRWMHEDNLFVFVPLNDGNTLREETWVGHKTSTRRVYERKLNKNDPNKTLVCKHFAFAVDFVLADDAWYMAIVPDWYFSYGDDYRRSIYADASITWLKKREVNRTVSDHFRFLTSWLCALDQNDLFSGDRKSGPTLTFGEVASFDNHPALADDSWLPIRSIADDDDASPLRGLFDAT